MNLNRIDFEDNFEDFFAKVEFPELRELHMISCSIDSEFPFFDTILLPKIEKLDLDDNDFDDIPLKVDKLESLEILSLKDNAPNLKYLYLARNYFEGEIPPNFINLKQLEVI